METDPTEHEAQTEDPGEEAEESSYEESESESSEEESAGLDETPSGP